jgi:hypothetical protein
MTLPKAPWNVPIPVKSARYEASNTALSLYNISVDLKSIEDAHSNPGSLAYSDLQNPLDTTDLRLGAGRSCFFRKKYIKGVGKTMLAGNWNDTRNLTHSSGHLLATSAVAEYLISLLLRKKNREYLVNPCEGVLASSLDTHIQRGFASKPQSLGCTVNRHIQCLTVKGDGFARYSNFIWFLQNSSFAEPVDCGNSIYRYLSLLYEATSLKPYRDPGLDLEKIFRSVERGIEACISNLTEAFHLGLDWTNYSNNFSLDGRFLDLETPLYYGAPILGFVKALTPDDEKGIFQSNQLFGFGILYALEQYSFFIKLQESHFSFLAKQTRKTNGVLADICESIVQVSRDTFHADHLLHSDEKIKNLILELYCDHIPHGLDRVRTIDSIYNKYLNLPDKSFRCRVALSKQIIADTGTCLDIGVLDKATDSRMKNLSDDVEWYNDTYKEFLEIRDVDNFLLKISDIERQLKLLP